MTNFNKLPPECDDLCRYRWCFQNGENKGTFVPGRGYTSYYKTPIHVCLTRHLHGCPDDVNGKRPPPHWDKIIPEIRMEIDNAKCTMKVRRLMKRMLDLIIYMKS